MHTQRRAQPRLTNRQQDHRPRKQRHTRQATPLQIRPVRERPVNNQLRHQPLTTRDGHNRQLTVAHRRPTNQPRDPTHRDRHRRLRQRKPHLQRVPQRTREQRARPPTKQRDANTHRNHNRHRRARRQRVQHHQVRPSKRQRQRGPTHNVRTHPLQRRRGRAEPKPDAKNRSQVDRRSVDFNGPCLSANSSSIARVTGMPSGSVASVAHLLRL